jgi:hypothetical protein
VNVARVLSFLGCTKRMLNLVISHVDLLFTDKLSNYQVVLLSYHLIRYCVTFTVYGSVSEYIQLRCRSYGVVVLTSNVVPCSLCSPVPFYTILVF